MAYEAVNVTGWNELYNGQLINAAYTMYDKAFTPAGAATGFFVFILFIIFQAMLWMKTQNVTLCWIMGIFFASMYAVSSFVSETSIKWIFILLVVQLAGILYMWMFK